MEDEFENLDYEDYEEYEGHPELTLSDDEPKGFRWGLALGVLVAAAIIGFMMMDGADSQTYFYTVDEAVALGPDLVGKTVRIKGTVEPGTVVGAPGTLARKFSVTEKGKSIKVSYDRAMPDTFDDNVEVVIQGTVNDDMVVEADEVMVKCPSRYEGAPPTATHPEDVPMKGADS